MLVAPICAFLLLVAIAVSVVLAVAHNSGGATPTPSPPPPLPSGPLRGLAYAPLPCIAGTCKEQLPNSDVMQIGYEKQWGSGGRNDLNVIKKLGGNAIRLYHSFGFGPRSDHGSFLDAAHDNGLSVLPGVDSDLAIHNCTDFDCYETVKEVIKTGFSLGFAKGKDWHPAIHTVILFNEPDFFANDPKCPQKASWCRVKAAISALDGLLAAEREANISGRVNLTTTWSFAALDSIDGKCKNCPGYFGFQDMLAVIENVSIAHYKPRTPAKDLADSFHRRWVNALNVQAPWGFVKERITKNYGPFGNRPWFIGEFGDLGQTHDILKNDVQAMHEFASANDSLFMGASIFQFQTAYWKGGSEMSFGLFGLGKEKIADTEDVCDNKGDCCKWPVYCLSTDLHWLPTDQAQRAAAVAAAWNGTVTGLCRNATQIIV